VGHFVRAVIASGVTYALAAALFVATAIGAVDVPARRATAVDPEGALQRSQAR
jgi:hypothetical protein